jgi:thiamine kinase-like enzyme
VKGAILSEAAQKVAALSFWRASVAPEPLGGGITNQNFTVVDGGETFVVRVGGDIPQHQIMRFNERAASQAAHAAGLSPEVVHAEPGILVLRFIAGKTLGEADVREDAALEKILPLIQACHTEMPKHVRGPVLMFWVFHVLRDYAHTLRESGSRHLPRLADLMDTANELETAVGPVEIVFGHNDLLAGNFIDDGKRMWLIDWDYAGFNSPLFDLANLAANNELAPTQEKWLLATYFGHAPDAALWRRYGAMKGASLLRETLWSMVSEIHSTIDFDYAGYTAMNLDRFERTLAANTKDR